MIKKSMRELNFIKGKEPLPTVEIHAESLEQQGLNLGQLVSKSLASFAQKNPGSLATIYSFGTMSVNFNEQAWSEFLIVAGDKKVLETLGKTLLSLRGVRSRYSDYVPPSEGRATYHVEAGCLWEVEDAVTWYSVEQADADSADIGGMELHDVPDPDDLDLKEIEESLAHYGDGSEDDQDDALEGDPTIPSALKRTGRMNAARADAKISTIRRNIEKVFGLPEGSVALCGPDGNPLKGNAFIKTLRRRWADS